jgi:hypothetical protein
LLLGKRLRVNSIKASEDVIEDLNRSGQVLDAPRICDGSTIYSLGGQKKVVVR